MKNLLLVAPLALLGCASAPSEAGLNLEERVSSLVEVYLDDNLYCTGSAAPIADGIYLTAWHVIDVVEAEWAEVYEVSIKIDGFSSIDTMHLGDLDAGLVFMDVPADQEFPAAWPISLRELSVGDEVLVSGWGLGSFWMTEGRSTGDEERLSVPVSPGDSGCPYFREDVGAILGIIVAKDTRAPNHTYVVPMSQIWAELPGWVRVKLAVLR